MIQPPYLKPGDRIAIITPASTVKEEFIDGASAYLEEKGFEPVVMVGAKGPSDGSYSADLNIRLSDFLTAWEDDSIKAVICGRGGYGAVHLLPHIPGRLLAEHPKWLVGFSDISALHALSVYQGVMSVHGPMCRHLKKGDDSGENLLDILCGNNPMEYSYARTDADLVLPLNHPGKSEGMLIGGNVAVLNGLAATPFDMFARALNDNVILFIEDIAEPVYKIERILYRLYMQGVLQRLKGLIVGQFTEYKPSVDFVSVEEMIEKFLETHNVRSFPVAYGFPCGHIESNMPLIEGANVELRVGCKSIELKML